MRAKTRHEESLGLETRVLLSSPDSDTDSEAGLDYETALARTEYGRFHYWLAVVCGWANASDAIEILCISFLLPSAECTELSKHQQEALHQRDPLLH